MNNTAKTKSTEAQLMASRRYRQGKARFPGTVLSDDEAELLERAAEKFGGKKAAIIKGLKKLLSGE